MRRYERAIANYAKAITLDPTAAALYSNRGNAYTSIGQYDLAIADYTKALQYNGTASIVSEIKQQLAQAYLHRGNRGVKKIGDTIKACTDFRHACELGLCRQYDHCVEYDLI